MTAPGRELAGAVLGCLAGSGLALYAARQPWTVTVTPRPAPLSPLRESLTGGDLAPWVPAAALVGLAAAVALYATRGRGRILVAGVAALAGAVVAAGGGYGIAAAGGPWPVACLAGGALVAVAGGIAVVRGRRWPSMGARYQAPGTPREHPARTADHDPARLWDALDTGTDPTVPRDTPRDTPREPS